MSPMRLADAHRPLQERAGSPINTPLRRVLMTADAVGGVWRYALDLSATLRDRDIEVTLAAMGPPPSLAQRRAADAAGVDVIAAPFKLEWQDEAWPDVDRAGAWLLDLESARRPDVVHLNGFCHASLPWQAPVIVAAHSCVCSWWQHVRGTDAPREWTEYRHRVAMGLACARMVVAPTAAMLGAIVREYGWVFSDARVIPNGVRRVSPATTTGGKSRLVLAAGRLWDDAKNIAALCQVAPAIEWPVYIAGDARRPSGRAAANDSPDDVTPTSTWAHVEFLGQLDPAQLESWFDRAAIYALPARYEPFGLSILEAAMAGCALVLGDIDSLRENWSGAAVFVAPDDCDALRTGLSRLIENPRERECLAVRARERARHLTVERAADAYLRAYADARTTPAHLRAGRSPIDSLKGTP